MGKRTRGIYGRLCGDFANRDRKSQHQQTNNRITQPSGAATPRNSDTHHAHRCSEGSLRSSGVPPAKTQKRQSLPLYPLATQGFRNVRNGPRVMIPPPSEIPVIRRVSPCVRSFEQSRVYPLSPVKANVGHLCEKLKIGMKDGLRWSCC